jgi:hypothetical protein
MGVAYRIDNEYFETHTRKRICCPNTRAIQDINEHLGPGWALPISQ